MVRRSSDTIDNADFNQSGKSHDCDALGKQVFQMYPLCSNQIDQYLKNATYQQIMLPTPLTLHAG